MGNNLGMWIQLLLIVVVFGGSAITALVRKLAEKAEQKKRQDALARARDESLRTGRAPEGTTEATPADTLAARRQAQLEELRRQQQERLRQARERAQQQRQAQQRQRQAGQPQVRTTPTQPQQRPVPNRPVPPAPRGNQIPIVITPVPEQPPARQRERQPQQARQKPTRRQPEAQPVVRRVERPEHESLRHMTRHDLRRAIIMKEVLDRPLAIREQSEDGESF